MEAGKQASLYLIARHGPYISTYIFMSEGNFPAWAQTNALLPSDAEASGGGFPGWLQRLKGHLRTTDTDYLTARNK